MLNTNSKPASERDLTHKFLLEHYHYDPVTGNWTRIKLNSVNQYLGPIGHVQKKTRYNYARIKAGNPPYRLARLAFFYMNGTWPANDMVIDHIDGDSSNDAWANLRLVHQSFNVSDAYLRNGKKLPTGLTYDMSRTYKDGSRRIRARTSRRIAGDAKLIGFARTVSEGIAILQSYYSQFNIDYQRDILKGELYTDEAI